MFFFMHFSQDVLPLACLCGQAARRQAVKKRKAFPI